MRAPRARILVLAAAVLWEGAGAGATSIREMNRKIKSQKQDLETLQDKIESLESEKGRLKRDEESLRRALRRIETEMDQSRHRQQRLKRQVADTEAQVRRMSRQVFFFSGERSRWENALFDDLRLYHVNFVFPERLRQAPLERQALRASLALKNRLMLDNARQKDWASQRERELRGSQARLIKLKGDLEQEIGRQKRAQQEKNELFRTTQGKRLIAEQEAQKLRETRDAMERLLSELVKKKEKTLAAQREEALRQRSLEGQRGRFAWPVPGTVVSQFGRQKHPELKITVINNGIRVRARPQEPVCAVEKGTVIFAGDFRSYGQTVILDHGGDVLSVYGLLGSSQVKEGQKIAVGQAIGATAAGDPQIYFEIRHQGRPEDPLDWLQDRK